MVGHKPFLQKGQNRILSLRDKPLIAAPRELDRRFSLISLTRLAKQRFLIANPRILPPSYLFRIVTLLVSPRILRRGVAALVRV